MKKRALTPLPRVEATGEWPVLRVSRQDRAYVAVPETAWQRSRRLVLASRDLLYKDLRAAALRGLILGFLAFAFVYGVWPQASFWLADWHWIFPLAIFIGVSVLLGLEVTLVCVCAAALFVSASDIRHEPVLFLVFLAGGVVVRCLYELLP